MEQINYTVGDEIVCVDVSDSIISDVRQPRKKLKKGKVYVAKAISQCSSCGCLRVDIGMRTVVEFSRCVCDQREPAHGVRWFVATRFTKALTTSEEADMEESIAEIMSTPAFQ